MGKHTRALPNFVYLLVGLQDNPAYHWMRCPTMGLEDGNLFFGAPTAFNSADLTWQWQTIPKSHRPDGVAGQVDYAALLKSGVVLIETVDVPGTFTNAEWAAATLRTERLAA
jgi:hypothetical protein